MGGRGVGGGRGDGREKRWEGKEMEGSRDGRGKR